LHTQGQCDYAKHADADHRGTIADSGSDKGDLDLVFVHGEQALRNRLAADGISLQC